MTKMTYVNAINEAINGNLTEEVVEKLEALKVSLAKRNAKHSNAPTKKQKENEGVKAEILAYLGTVEEGQTAGAIGEKFGFSNQKASALLTQLLKAEMVTRETVKGKALFSLA